MYIVCGSVVKNPFSVSVIQKIIVAVNQVREMTTISLIPLSYNCNENRSSRLSKNMRVIGLICRLQIINIKAASKFSTWLHSRLSYSLSFKYRIIAYYRQSLTLMTHILFAFFTDMEKGLMLL